MIGKPDGFRTDSARKGDGFRTDSESLARAGADLRSKPSHSQATPRQIHARTSVVVKVDNQVQVSYLAREFGFGAKP